MLGTRVCDLTLSPGCPQSRLQTGEWDAFRSPSLSSLTDGQKNPISKGWASPTAMLTTLVKCAGLKKNGPCRLIYLMFSHQGIELFDSFRRIRTGGLLEELCHWGWVLRFSKAHTQSGVFLFSLSQSVDQDVAS